AVEEGLAKGFEKGMAQGIEKGIEKGRTEGFIEAARNMKSLGISTELIIKATGLTAEEIENIE
ncbi:MAG: hypothetical protein J6C92_02735, partial [Bacteroidaceae bacterium]|nr:hypothetical protein [Bacteroidaceae bacterium]